MNDPGNPELPRAGTIAARFLAMRQDMEQVARACIADRAYDTSKLALAAAEAIDAVWADFPIESEECDWPWDPKPWTRDRTKDAKSGVSLPGEKP